jgi:hypothetical protein
VKAAPRKPAAQLILARDRRLVENVADRGMALLIHGNSSAVPSFSFATGRVAT